VDRIRTLLAADPTVPPRTSFSVGVEERPADDPRSIEALVDAADRGMYQERMLRRLRATPPPAS
jgi:hypothetical protein